MRFTIEDPENLKKVNARKPSVLLPGHRVYYHKLGYTDDRRFIRVFRATWKKIPLSDRRAILNVWREHPLYRFGWAPRVECLNFCSSFDKARESDEDGEMPLGMFKPFGMQFIFWAPVVSLLPDHLLEVLIAHELAHLAFAIEDKLERPELYHNDSFVRRDRESDAYWEEMETCCLNFEQWGFDEDALSQWCADNRETLQSLQLRWS